MTSYLHLVLMHPNTMCGLFSRELIIRHSPLVRLQLLHVFTVFFSEYSFFRDYACTSRIFEISNIFHKSLFLLFCYTEIQIVKIIIFIHYLYKTYNFGVNVMSTNSILNIELESKEKRKCHLMSQ